MNEKIIDLAKQAAATKKYVPPVWQFFDDELELFANLIIQECLSIVEYKLDVYDKVDLSDYNKGWVNGRKLAIEQIKDYFEVKNVQ